jgi:hypothetical protein
MKKIDISTRKHPNTFSLVDDEDFAEINRHKWSPDQRGDNFYVIARPYGYKEKQVYLHRFLMKPSSDLTVDHIDHNGLNNQKSNLRVCTQAENLRNRRLQSNNTSGYKGAYWHRTSWVARIKHNGKNKHLGVFSDLIDAAKAYDAAAKEYCGEFAKLNFPERVALNQATADNGKLKVVTPYGIIETEK